MVDFSQPKKELLKQQAAWLAPARSRMLRRIGIARIKNILDLGAGFGSVSGELQRRSGGRVVALDIVYDSLCEMAFSKGVFRVAGDATQLPFSSVSFGLVFCQVGMIWMKPLRDIVHEIHRVLDPGGVFLSIEPDYLSMIEYPPETAIRDIWISTLEQAGADIEVCRKLPAELESAGFSVRIDLLEKIEPPAPSSFELLHSLSLGRAEKEKLEQVEHFSGQTSGWSQIRHLPFFLTTSVKH